MWERARTSPTSISSSMASFRPGAYATDLTPPTSRFPWVLSTRGYGSHRPRRGQLRELPDGCRRSLEDRGRGDEPCLHRFRRPDASRGARTVLGPLRTPTDAGAVVVRPLVPKRPRQPRALGTPEHRMACTRRSPLTILALHQRAGVFATTERRGVL